MQPRFASAIRVLIERHDVDCAIACAVDDGGRTLAHASYRRLYGYRAELSLDPGAGERRDALAALLQRLGRLAEGDGIHHFIARVDPNQFELVRLVCDGLAGDPSSGRLELNFATAVCEGAAAPSVDIDGDAAARSITG
jgi:hypothetical protein